METPSIPRLGKLSSGGASRGRPPKQAHPQEAARTTTTAPENSKHSTPCSERGEGKKKGRPTAEVQELKSIPANMMVQWKEEFKKSPRVKCPCSGCWLEFPSIYGLKYHYQRCQGVTLAEKVSHGCPDCKAVFPTKVRLQKHKLWNHPERATIETKAEPKLRKTPVKWTAKKRPIENTPPSPVFFKVKKTQEVSSPSQNGECAPQRGERKQYTHPQPPQQQVSSSDTSPNTPGGSESEGEGSSLPPPYPNEDPERTRHRRKQKTPKKFTGEQPSISGTFGLKGMNKVEEKLKAGRVKRLEGGLFSEEPQGKHPGPASRRDPPPLTSGTPAEAQWQHAITERGEVVCPTCSIVTRKTVSGLKKHMEICQKLQDALKCQQCQKQFRSKAGLNYHTMAEHSSKASGSEGQMGDGQEERERLRRVLKQMGRIKCPSEGCSAHFSSLMGYQYHQKRCGRELSEEDKPVFLCQHCGKSYRSKSGRDYHLRTEHPTTTTNNNTNNINNTTGRGVTTEESQPQPAGRREQNHMERERKKKEKWQGLSAGREKERERDGRKREREWGGEREGLGEDFERTPSGRVRRQSAQVAVFHLQEIAEDELAKDWGTKRRIKDDLVPDSKRLNYTRPGLPKFSPKLLESWKNEVKEKGFICCSNGSCEAVYSSVSGLKAHLANCNQAGGDAGKYTCLLCQKEFSSESGVKYHISKTHSQNWFRASSHMVPSSSISSKSKPSEHQGIEKTEVKNGATMGKKRGRKPKERPPEATPVQTNTIFSTTQNSAPTPNPTSAPTPNMAQAKTPVPTERGNTGSLTLNRQPNPPTTRRSKPKWVPPPSE
ncbi:zinc finger protein 512B isoform X1 [Coregonus clupeaformis]|uniref:zinc finger protein 512B isoform X1 n=2 Tax=Coregonus clupeaformis TaxID=59861 RepID=UPI001E1C6A09|nr:zinc finger protein 512B isoform X1 [Coregonus clupeaformis]XP_041702736.2 zinc finger protein 512B isoform X1 [Coregonus clupeaformis]